MCMLSGSGAVNASCSRHGYGQVCSGLGEVTALRPHRVRYLLSTGRAIPPVLVAAGGRVAVFVIVALSAVVVNHGQKGQFQRGMYKLKEAVRQRNWSEGWQEFSRR